MRKLVLILSLALASCGGNPQANNAAVAEESSAADICPVNDTTAIDAATGEAANMAADVNYTVEANAVGGGNAAVSTTTGNRPAPARRPATSATTTTAPTTSNTTATQPVTNNTAQ